MANFRVFPGQWIVTTEDIGPLKVGMVRQVLGVKNRFCSFFTLVGEESFFEYLPADPIDGIPIYSKISVPKENKGWEWLRFLQKR